VRRYKIIAILILPVMLCGVFTAVSYSQGAAGNEGRTIASVNVKNNRVISTETILAKIKTRAQEKFSQDVVNDDIKRLYAMQFFTDISIDVEERDDGVAVTFLVEEKPVIEDIVFKGNTALRSQKLKSTMKSKPNEMLNLTLLAQDIAEIKEQYIKKGYPLAEVAYTLGVDKETNKATINIAVDEKTHIKVASINISGNKAVPTNKIKKILGTKPAWLFNPGVFKEEVLQEDLDKIRAMYDDIGYLDVDAVPRLDYIENGTKLNINVDVIEGKQYKVGDISVKGNLVLPEKDVNGRITMKKGKPFSTRMLRDDSSAVRQYYYKYGYMNVIVDVDRQLNQDTGDIDIVYNVDAKEIVYVGKIEVKGNTKTRDVVVRREVRLYPGDKFDGDKIRRSKERIYNLGFFENVGFDTEATGNPNVQDLVVNVKETKTGEFSFGGGYSSVDMLLGFVEITQRNFDLLNFPSFTGAGQNLSIKAEIGMVRNNFDLAWTEPWIFGYPYLFGFDVYRTTHYQKGELGWAYDESRTGFNMRLGKEFTDYIRADLNYRIEEVQISDVIDNASQDFKDEAGKNWISKLTFDLTVDTRDNIFNPMRGYVANGYVENAGGIIMGDKDFVKGGASAAYYHTFFQKIVLEVKGRLGLESAYSDTAKVPIYERFYAGGANTIRGYKERRVGPRDTGSNEPIGGESMLIGNAELTFPIYERVIKGAVFYDVGNVWGKMGDFVRGGEFRSGAGVGLRVKTPVGPVKVDYGYPLNKNYQDERTGEFYFSMSRGF